MISPLLPSYYLFRAISSVFASNEYAELEHKNSFPIIREEDKSAAKVIIYRVENVNFISQSDDEKQLVGEKVIRDIPLKNTSRKGMMIARRWICEEPFSYSLEYFEISEYSDEEQDPKPSGCAKGVFRVLTKPIILNESTQHLCRNLLKISSRMEALEFLVSQSFPIVYSRYIEFDIVHPLFIFSSGEEEKLFNNGKCIRQCNLHLRNSVDETKTSSSIFGLTDQSGTIEEKNLVSSSQEPRHYDALNERSLFPYRNFAQARMKLSEEREKRVNVVDPQLLLMGSILRNSFDPAPRSYNIAEGWARWGKCLYGLQRWWCIKSLRRIIEFTYNSPRAASRSIEILDHFMAVAHPNMVKEEIEARMGPNALTGNGDSHFEIMTNCVYSILACCILIGCKIEDPFAPRCSKVTLCMKRNFENINFHDLETLISEKVNYDFFSQNTGGVVNLILYILSGDDDSLYETKMAKAAEHSPWAHFQRTCRLLAAATEQGIYSPIRADLDAIYGVSSLDLHPILLGMSVVLLVAEVHQIKLPEPFLSLFPSEYIASRKCSGTDNVPLLPSHKRYYLFKKFIEQAVAVLKMVGADVFSHHRPIEKSLPSSLLKKGWMKQSLSGASSRDLVVYAALQNVYLANLVFDG